jgi:hypothetical protein
MDRARQVADAVLYEGYLLWPYRRSALKNQQRWTFGGVYPEAHSARAPDDGCAMQVQCLLEARPACTVEVRLRFLHVVDRCVVAWREGRLQPVDELVVAGERHLSWDEAREREVVARASLRDLLAAPTRASIEIDEGTADEPLLDEARVPVAALRRSWLRLRGELELRADPAGSGVARLTARAANTTPFAGDRRAALRQTFCSAHAVLELRDGAFVSLTDPPPALRSAAAACENVGTWPVLLGEEGERGRMLASPIILPDYPQVAPESPGDLFDGTEIDGLLILGILSLTEAEQAEMRATDPRAREILERCAALTPEQLLRLHGQVREVRPA